jgi:hypothetical protein
MTCVNAKTPAITAAILCLLDVPRQPAPVSRLPSAVLQLRDVGASCRNGVDQPLFPQRGDRARRAVDRATSYVSTSSLSVGIRVSGGYLPDKIPRLMIAAICRYGGTGPRGSIR